MRDAHFARARVLLEQGRYDLAEGELRLALAADPQDAEAHAFLSLCLAEREAFAEAEAEAQAAVGAAPDLPLAHAAHGAVLLKRRRYDEAARASDEALRLDPFDAANHALRAQVRMHLRRWQAALEAAEEGLRVDPENVVCSNLRAAALVNLGRRDEAARTVEAALALDPEDASTHATQGWALLHQGDARKALDHFRESLRLDPASEFAREGLVEALKARNPVYALLLRWFLFISRLSGRAQWGIILGGYVAYRVVSGVAQRNPAAAPYLNPLLYAYIGFALLTWVAYPLFNLALRLHPMGKHALSPDQRRGANLVGACVFLALGGLAAHLATDFVWGGFIALTFGLLLPSVAAIHSLHAGWPRVAMAAYAAALLSLRVAVVIVAYAWTGLDEKAVSLISTLNTLFFLGALLSQFAAMALQRVEPRR